MARLASRSTNYSLRKTIQTTTEGKVCREPLWFAILLPVIKIKVQLELFLHELEDGFELRAAFCQPLV